MTLVNIETGELTEQMTADDARRLTERIRIAATNYTEAKAKVLALVDEAKAGHAHIALGYASWTAYLSDVLSDEPLRLARDERRELHSRLADEGMSGRAIARITDTSEATVRRDVAATASDDAVAKVRETTGLDGKVRAAVTAGRAPAQRATPRKPLPDQFWEAAYDLAKAVERVERLTTDDRFPQNAVQVGTKHRADLVRAIELLSKALDRFPY